MPLIIVSPVHDIQSTQELFLDHDYFGFDSEKVSKPKFPLKELALTISAARFFYLVILL